MDLITGVKTINSIPHLILLIIRYKIVVMLGLFFVAADFVQVENVDERIMFTCILQVFFFCNGRKAEDFAGAEALKFFVRDVVIKDGFHAQLYHRRTYAC